MAIDLIFFYGAPEPCAGIRAHQLPNLNFRPRSAPESINTTQRNISAASSPASSGPAFSLLASG
ncbi:MAG TPA: hypothetical protein VG273_20485, partial [Bryobacteraceae bacterium]|nr:hypothetical protein [Bryobacteraceae bacterium]